MGLRDAGWEWPGELPPQGRGSRSGYEVPGTSLANELISQPSGLPAICIFIIILSSFITR